MAPAAPACVTGAAWTAATSQKLVSSREALRREALVYRT